MNDKRNLWVSIDTEMDADIHWKKRWPPEYSSVCEGIPKLLRPIWDEYHVHPIYFVSPEILYSEACCSILKGEIAKGAIIGAHLHPEYIAPDSRWGEGIERIEPQFPNSACSVVEEKEKICNLTNLIKDKLGVRPIWYRAARFGDDLDTINSLKELGYQYDSSVTPNIDWTSKEGPNHSKAPLTSYQISVENFYQKGNSGVQEVPVTILGKRFGIMGKLFPNNWLFYRWLRPTHMTYLEMKHIISELSEQKELVMMFHSMEIMVNKTPYVRAKWMQRYFVWRLRKILSYAGSKGYLL